MPDWSSLPPEVRAIILRLLTFDNYNYISPYATVSEEWRYAIEKKNFGHLKLHPACLDSLERLTDQQKGLVKHIWLNIELKRYTCRICQKMETYAWFLANDKIIAAAITRLFLILAEWKTGGGDLTLELNAYSPSDSEHWFKNCYFGAPDEDELELLEPESQPQCGTTATAIHDPSHGWWHGRMIEAPGDDALRRPFELATLNFQQELPSVPAVTKFLLRRQCRRQLDPSSLSYLWSKLPQLVEIIYEPWQLSEKVSQDTWDTGYKRMIGQRLPTSVKTVRVFEDFNENYLDLFQLFRGRNLHLNPDRVRITTPLVGAAFAARSRQLEHLSVAFLADAYHFFNACKPYWRWHQLRSLTFTSRMMHKTNQPRISKLLEAAAQSAINMPKLETMTLWNGAKGEACSFTWCRQGASISWRGTWDLKLEPSVLTAWKVVAYEYARHEFTVNKELLTHKIGSHGDAIQYLGLQSVVDDTSLRQIRKENNYG
ncbi:hypothetical protein FDECE_5533 [Fusarium decemcellulare]|nr:hypothetical protein FDECE_5533 [Fusarium decemcellulare]